MQGVDHVDTLKVNNVYFYAYGLKHLRENLLQSVTFYATEQLFFIRSHCDLALH